MGTIEEIRHQNLLALIAEYGGQRKFADAAGIKTAAQVSQWVNRSPHAETGKPRVLSSKSCRNIERALNRPEGWMDTVHKAIDARGQDRVEEAPYPYFSTGETRRGYVRFPLLEGYAGMGRGDYIGDYPEITDWIEVTREWASQKLRGVPFDAVRIITGRGQSMRGVYNDGDLVFVDSRVKKFIGDSAYCFRWAGHVHIKRLQLIGEGMVRILSSNPAYENRDVPLNEIEIGGRALAAWTLAEF